MHCTPPAPLSMTFLRQEYWSGLPIPPPGDLPNPGIEPRSPSLQADSLPAELLSLHQTYSFYWCWVLPRCWRLPAAQRGGCRRLGWLWQSLRIGQDCKSAASPDSSFHEQSLCMQCCLAAFCPRQKFFQNWSWSPQTLLLLSQISSIS